MFMYFLDSGGEGILVLAATNRPQAIDAALMRPGRFDLAFIIASTATDEEMLRWYRERVVWTEKQLILELERKGFLTGICTPMVIIQALREAGVFCSVISAAASKS